MVERMNVGEPVGGAPVARNGRPACYSAYGQGGPSPAPNRASTIGAQRARASNARCFIGLPPSLSLDDSPGARVITRD